eukprot:m.62312 g.62312  ORF g.62312 m.62312 type:complete len:178 (-) comp13929_c0_seq2:307-840(-)
MAEELSVPSPELKERWVLEQDALKAQMVLEDQLSVASVDEIRLVGGVDISFIKGDDVNACASLVVVELPTLTVVYESHVMVKLTAPYISGFLAFREVPHLVALVKQLEHDAPAFKPQVILVDGNGELHHRGFGLACHLGVLVDIPTVCLSARMQPCLTCLFKEVCMSGWGRQEPPSH